MKLITKVKNSKLWKLIDIFYCLMTRESEYKIGLIAYQKGFCTDEGRLAMEIILYFGLKKKK